MSLALTIQDQPNGTALPDLTARLTRAVFSTNLHGDEALQIGASLGLASAFQRYDGRGTPHALVTDGAAIPFQGRVEDVAIRSTGLDMTAFGYSRSLGDAPYTALWSTTDLQQWRPMTSADSAGYTPEKYTFDQNSGQLYLTCKKGLTYANGADVGAWIIRIPDDSVRQLAGVSFDYTINLPFGWSFELQRWTNAFAFQSNTVIVAAVGVPFNRTLHATVSGCDIIALVVYNNTGAPSTPAGDDGTHYLQIRNLRAVTSIGNRVNTTLGTTFGAGGPQTVTPPSMANIYVGQQLQIRNNTNTSSSVIVTAITATTFSAIFPGGYNTADAVNAFVVYADEIVKDARAVISTLNPLQLAATDSLIQSPGVDLIDELYQDRSIPELFDYLASLGDNQTPPNQWEWGVGNAQQLYFRAAGSLSRTWYVDVAGLDVQRSVEPLINSAYAVYQDANGRLLRGAVSTDAESVSRTALTRQQAVPTSGTSLTQANVRRDATLDDDADPAPRFGITFNAIYNSVGGRVPLWMPRAGDTIVIRNLPPTLSVSIDQIRSFRIARTSCDLIARTLTVEPLTPLPNVAALLARALPSGAGFHGQPFIAPH